MARDIFEEVKKKLLDNEHFLSEHDKVSIGRHWLSRIMVAFWQQVAWGFSSKSRKIITKNMKCILGVDGPDEDDYPGGVDPLDL